MRGLPVSFPNIYAIFLTTMVILQIPMTANTHDISAPDAAGRMVRAADILIYAYFLTADDGFPQFGV